MRNSRRAMRRPMAEINVVPYVDVSFVLLVIFMVTTPLMTQGVNVDLPQANAEPQVLPDSATLPVIIHVDRFGDLFIDLGDGDAEPVDEDGLFRRLRGALAEMPDTPVLMRADHAVAYGRVVEAMVAAQAAGVPSVGLVTEPHRDDRSR